jgi:flavin-dependent dehydrogenase
MEVGTGCAGPSPAAAALSADVAILGGGPAGAALATLLAKRGVDVLLADRDRFPRDKVCGEFLSWDALPLLDRIGAASLLDEAGSPRLERCRIVGERGDAEFPLPGVARGISRLRLDAALVDRARRAGARVLEGCAAEDVVSGDDGFEISLTGGDGPMRIRARSLVGAWGRWGRLDLRLGRAFVADRRQRYIGFKRHYAAGAVDDGVIELHSFPRGYLGAQAIEGGRSNICGLVHQSVIAGLRGGWPSFVAGLAAGSPRLARLFATDPAQEAFLSSEPVIFRAKEPVHRGIVLVGDAAGLIDPLTGNGMAMALQSAALAVAPLLAALSGGDRAAAFRAYAAAHQSFFGARLRWSRAVARAMRHPRFIGSTLPVSRLAGPALARLTRATDAAIDRLLATL